MIVVLSFKGLGLVKVMLVPLWSRSVCTFDLIFKSIKAGEKKVTGEKKFGNGANDTMLLF